MAGVIYDRMPLDQYICPDDPIHGFGFVLFQCDIHVRQIKHDQVKIIIFPTAKFQNIPVRDLGNHIDRAGARGQCWRIGSAEVKSRHAVESHAAVGRAGIEDEVAFNAVDCGFNQQVIGFGKLKFYLFI